MPQAAQWASCPSGAEGAKPKARWQEQPLSEAQKGLMHLIPSVVVPPPSLSKIRPGEKKVRSERGVCLRQGRALGTKSLIPPNSGANKCGPNGGCALDTGVPWTREGG